MSPCRRVRAVVALVATACLLSGLPAQAQQSTPAPVPGAAEPSAPPPPQPVFETRPNAPLTPGPDAPPPAQAPVPPPEVPVPPPQPAFETWPDAPRTPAPPAESSGLFLDGHERSGPFLSGPGSLTFILHHTLMGAAGGLATQGLPRGFSLELGSRETMLAGLLVGAGAGFASSAWWQFNHWIDCPVANFGIAASMISSMFCTGLMDLVSNDTSVLTWTAFAGAELGAWLTIALAGGQMTTGSALAIGSGGAWALAYAGLMLAILVTSGNHLAVENTADTLLIAPGLGAGFMALTLLKFQPTSSQVLRADLFGAAVGVGVLVLSGIVLGRFDIATPYILSLLGSAGAIGAVSLLWEEKAERPGTTALWPAAPRDDRYRSVWW